MRHFFDIVFGSSRIFVSSPAGLDVTTITRGHLL